jgi:hypothetical protein
MDVIVNHGKAPTMTAPLKLRQFRFGLLTLFVVMTLACVTLAWIVWQMQIVRARKAVLTELAEVPGFSANTLENLESDPISAINPDYRTLEFMRVSRIRRLLGDESYTVLHVPPGLRPELLDSMEIAFPESVLLVKGPRPKTDNAYRDSLYAPASVRQPNAGHVFKTGLIEQ